MNLSNENKLLLLCSRVSVNANIISQIKNLIKQKLDWNLLFVNATQEKILPLVYFHLSRLSLMCHIPSELASEFKRISFGITGNNVSIYKELNRLLKLFKQSNLDVIVLKGASYIETLYHNISLRSMGDIDLLVKEDNLQNARELLLNNGYIQQSGWTEHQQIDTHHLPHFIHQRNKTVVELHWTIGMYEEILPINMDEIWNRVHTIQFETEKMQILSPEDMILHQCCHLFIVHGGEFSLKNLCDLSEIIQKYRQTINWDLIINCSIRYKIAVLVYGGIFLVQQIYNRAIPIHVTEKLKTKYSAKQLSWLQNFVNNDFISEKKGKIKTPLSRLLWFNGPRNKVKYLLITLFPPHDLLIKRYSLNKNSKLFILYYLVRPIQLLNKNGKSTLKLIINLPLKIFRRFFN